MLTILFGVQVDANIIYAPAMTSWSKLFPPKAKEMSFLPF